MGSSLPHARDACSTAKTRNDVPGNSSKPADDGWHSFDQSLLAAYKTILITDETAMIFCAQNTRCVAISTW